LSGDRLPAEYEPIDTVWLTRPDNRETWPGVLEQALSQWQVFAEALAQVVRVRVTQDEGIAVNDAWVRDYGPLFVEKDGALVAHDFRFNGWGNKYEVRSLDDAAGKQIAELAQAHLIHHDMVLEGGSIETDGQGTLLTTEQCLLNPNRNPSMSREQIEQMLSESLGVSQILWLPRGIEGDDTDGHIDDVARFIEPGKVVCISAQPDHPDHDMTQQNLTTLKQARDARGQALEIIELPMPSVRMFDYPADRFGPGGEEALPASYANFLMVNGTLFCPTFGDLMDDRACDVLAQALPNWRIEPIRSEWLVVGLGALHCLSMHQAAVTPSTG